MKLKQKFILREIANEAILIPIMNKDDLFNGVISLNETGVFIWKQLENEKSKEEIVSALLEEYEVSIEQARKNVDDFFANLEKLHLL